MKTIGVIGGDLRQLSLAKEFKNDGYEVFTYGLTGLEAPNDNRAFSSDIIILPLPVSNGNKLNMPFSEEDLSLKNILEKIQGNPVIFGGKFPLWFAKALNDKKFTYHDYLERPEFPVYNAVPTAEGAIEIAINETPFTINGCKALVTGYGNISKILSGLLKSMGADTELAIRSKQQAAEAECHGFKVFHPNEILSYANKYNIIFNTVPSMLFSASVLECVPEDTLIIDLASKPGGVDFDAAGLLSKRVIWALSLPGKTSPVTAGIIIKKTIANILNETEGIKNA